MAPYTKTGKHNARGEKLYRTPKGHMVTLDQIKAIEAKKRRVKKDAKP